MSTATKHGGAPPAGPRLSTHPRSATLTYSEGDHARSWGWWCRLCTPADAAPHQVVGSPPVMLQGSARKVATAHERTHHSRPTT